MADRIPQPHHIVNDVMRRWPETAWLFMHYGMACAGCPVGALHTVENAALEYQVPLQTFLSELRIAAATRPKPQTAKSNDPPVGKRPSASRMRRRKDRRQHLD
jgi:hybrid cluster-associated redox disulfide protein